jgi:hypothetical protein
MIAELNRLNDYLGNLQISENLEDQKDENQRLEINITRLVGQNKELRDDIEELDLYNQNLQKEEQDYNLLDKEIVKLESIEAELKEENANLEASLRKNNMDPNVEMGKKMDGYKKRLEGIFDKMMYMDDFDYSPYEIKVDEGTKIDPSAGLIDAKDLVYNLKEMEDLGNLFFALGKKNLYREDCTLVFYTE